MSMTEEFFQPGCPWWDMRVTFGEPNVKWCEATLCSWVNEPANSWSNVAYFLVALACAWQWSRTKRRTPLRFAWTVGLVGIFSFAFHATNNFATQLLDFIGMYVLMFLVVALNLSRMGWLARQRVGAVHVGLTTGFTLLVPVMKYLHFPYQGVVLLGLIFIIASEVIMARQSGPRPPYRDFKITVGLMAAAIGFSVSDVTRTWCDPSNHWIQGHAMWHVLTATALLFAARHYETCEAMEVSGQPAHI